MRVGKTGGVNYGPGARTAALLSNSSPIQESMASHGPQGSLG